MDLLDSNFNFLNYCALFHSGYTILQSHQQYTEVTVSTHPHQHSFLCVFVGGVYLIVAIALVRWHLIVILICISVLISDVEHLFICVLTICMSPLEKCLSCSSTHFLFGFFFFHNKLHELFVYFGD